VFDESKTIHGIEIRWDTAHGTMESIQRALAAFWLDPSLLHMLEPLRDEVGTELFRLIVAHSSSLGTKEDYETMVTVFGETFEEGFLAWGRAVGVIGWGRFELPAIDRARGTATVLVRSPWELVMQQRLAAPWGCPFLMGKMIGIFRHALGVNCWAAERHYVEEGEPVLELSLYQSPATIESELKRLRSELARLQARKLQDEVVHRTELHRSSEERLRAILSSMSSWVFTLDPAGHLESNHVPDGVSDPGFPSRYEPGAHLSDMVPSQACALILEASASVIESGSPRTCDYRLAEGASSQIYSARLSPLRDAAMRCCGTTVVVQNVTAQRLAQDKEAQLQEQLRQAQKMEALGQLTGGVAHDFNNLLTAISGNLELAMAQSTTPAAAECLRSALQASDSAAKLTHRLLAFSRKQPLQPRRLDPQQLIASMESLLRRTLGEQIEIELVGSAGQWQCEVDATQLESAVLNLAINARDAMPEGGKITIETGNARIAPEYADEYEGLLPGRYVLVAVSDTGCGMPEDVQGKAFDPFFTTKGVGRGSGLGLSMVYGFVKQSNGHVKIYSEPNIGTTIKLYLPRASTRESQSHRPVSMSGPVPLGSGEVVLVVEDDGPVRRVSVEFLRSLGYQTLDCGDAEEALAILRGATQVDVLFTDVVLPGGVNGAQLASDAMSLRPSLVVLYTSGYTENAILHHGRFDENVHLVEKPFTRDVLARRLFAAIHPVRLRE